jgi:hypothetical protein
MECLLKFDNERVNFYSLFLLIPARIAQRSASTDSFKVLALPDLVDLEDEPNTRFSFIVEPDFDLSDSVRLV